MKGKHLFHGTTGKKMKMKIHENRQNALPQ